MTRHITEDLEISCNESDKEDSDKDSNFERAIEERNFFS